MVYATQKYLNFCTSSVNNSPKKALNWLKQIFQWTKMCLQMDIIETSLEVLNVYFMRTQTKCRFLKWLLVNSLQFILSAWLMCKMVSLFGKII